MLQGRRRVGRGVRPRRRFGRAHLPEPHPDLGRARSGQLQVHQVVGVGREVQGRDDLRPDRAAMPLTTRRTLRIICPDGVISTDPRYWAVPTLRPITITRTESPTGRLADREARHLVGGEHRGSHAALPAATRPARSAGRAGKAVRPEAGALLLLYDHAPPVGALPHPGDCARSNRSPAITGFGFGAELSVKLVPVVVPTSTPLR